MSRPEFDKPSEIENPETYAVAPVTNRPGRTGWLDHLKERPRLWQGKWGPAFWTVTGSISLLTNIILLVVLISIGRELFALKELLSTQLIGGLYGNFVDMDNATIETTVEVDEIIVVEDIITVDDTIPVVFDLVISQRTEVTLSEDMDVDGAIVNIRTPNLAIFNAPADITLPEDTELPIRLDLTVPVSQTVAVNLLVPIRLEVPVSLSVPVSIPLNETELHEPFVGLQDVVAPYRSLLLDLPDSWGEAACQAGPILCWLFGGR